MTREERKFRRGLRALVTLLRMEVRYQQEWVALCGWDDQRSRLAYVANKLQ